MNSEHQETTNPLSGHVFLSPLEPALAGRALRLIQGLLFVGLVFLGGSLWKKYASAPTLVGQAEVVPANVSCYKSGMLAQLFVNRFQAVKSGDPIGQVLVTDPKILVSSLAVIQAEIEAMRASQTPVA